MMFFGLVFQARSTPDAALSLDYREQSRIQALLRSMIRRLRQQRKLALVLATCLCLSTSAQADVLDPLLKLWKPYRSLSASVVADSVSDNNSSSNQATPTAKLKSDNLSLATDERELTDFEDEPSLYALLDAEFAADRSDIERGLTLYKQQAFKRDATAVFERALSLSLDYEAVDESLAFARNWQEQNPDHVPAWFYVAHLALKAHDYALAGETLNRILRYDPRADLSEILIGIYPSTDADRRELLAALQPIDSEQNASISVLKAGLLYQFDEPEAALIHIEQLYPRK